MGIKLRKHGTVTATFATAQQVDISHANDSVRVGDGTDLMGPLQNIGGVLCFPMRIMGDNAGLATSANLTAGTARVKVGDGVDNVGVETVGAEKALKVAVISTVGGGAAPAFTDDAAFTQGTTQCTPIGALFDDTATDSVDENDVGVVRMTADRILMTQLKSVAAGVAVPVTDNGGSITVDGTFWQATQPISAASLPLPTGASTLAEQQTQTTALQLIDDIVFTDKAAYTPSTSKGAAIMAQMDDTAPSALAEGQVGALRATTNRALHASLRYDATGNQIISQQLMADSIPVAIASNQSAIPVTQSGAWNIGLNAGTNNIGDVDILSIAAGDNNIGNVDIVTMPAVAGAAAHDAAVSGNPVRIAGRAMLANGTAVAEDDTADIATDNQGRILNTPHVPRDLTVHGTATLTATTETTILAAVASTFLDIVKIVITNSSATAVRVAVKDATAGTTRIEVALAANGGAVIDFGAVPLTQNAVNNNWTVSASAAVTSLYCFAQAIKRIA